MDHRETSRTTLPEGTPMLHASRVVGLVVAASAALVLFGWVADIEPLKSLLPGLVTMKVNTAVSLLLLAVAVAARRRGVTIGAVALVLAITVGTLLEYAAGLDLGIDELVIADPARVGNNPPGRMAPTSAVCLLVLALSMLAALRGLLRTARTLHLSAFFLGAVAMLGYVYGVEEFYAVTAYATMAAHTAVLVALTAVALDLALPGSLIRAGLSDPGPGGQLIRRFVPLALVGIPATGYARLRLGDLGLFGDRFGVAVMATFAAMLVMTLTWVSARSLSITDREEQRAREELRVLNASLVEGRDEAWRRAEELTAQLTREREVFGQAISRFDDLVWTLHIHDHIADLVYASPNAAGVLGGPIDEGIDVSPAMLRMVHTDDRPLYDAFAATIAAGDPAEMELRVTGVDGELRWLWVRASPRTDQGHLYVDGIISNVTERHLLGERVLELERERFDELQRTQELRDHFVAMAGHELRTPLTVAGGYVSLVLRSAELDPMHRDHLETSLRGLNQAAAMVSDFFDLARLQAGIVQVELEPLDLAALVADAVAGHAQEAEAAGLELVARVPERLEIAGDPKRIVQIVDNLVSNALKYTPSGGHVELDLDRVDGEARLRVRDDGIGIPDDELPLVFDYLFRASTATARGIKGSGLGLALTKTLVDAHRGRISARSRDVAGAEFEVRLPVAAGAGETVVESLAPSQA